MQRSESGYDSSFSGTDTGHLKESRASGDLFAAKSILLFVQRAGASLYRDDTRSAVLVPALPGIVTDSNRHPKVFYGLRGALNQVFAKVAKSRKVT